MGYAMPVVLERERYPRRYSFGVERHLGLLAIDEHHFVFHDVNGYRFALRGPPSTRTARLQEYFIIVAAPGIVGDSTISRA